MEKENYLKQKYEEPPEEPKKASNKKNTRKWCKGKVNVKHIPEWIENPKSVGNSFSVYQCQVCGKVLDYCFMWSWAPLKECKCGLHKKGIE